MSGKDFWEHLSKSETDLLEDEDREVIYYWYKSDKSIFLVLNDDTILFKAHLEMKDWKSALDSPNKGVKYEKDILKEIKALDEEKQGQIKNSTVSKSWMKSGSKDKVYIIKAEHPFCVFATLLSLPYEASGILLQNTDTPRAQKHSPISLVKWLLSYLDENQKDLLDDAAKDYLKALKAKKEEDA